MDKKEAVKELLSKGEIPTPELIEKMISGGILGRGEALAEDREIKTEAKPTKIGGVGVKEEPIGVEMKITTPERRDKLTTEDFTSYNNDKYNGLRKILSPKVDAISINKAREMFGEVGVIGMVKEKTPTGYIIEDTTGSIELVINNSNILSGDVIGASGQIKENKLFGKGIILPDIPLTQKYNLLNGIILTLSRKKSGGPGVCIGVDGLSNGSRVSLSNNDGTVNILFYSPKTGAGAQECVESLKKRHLVVSNKEIISPKDDFVITAVPDILWVNSDTKFTESYKGVVIISPGNEETSIDLGTKKVY